MNITTIGIDIAKNIFQLHGIDKKGEVLLKKKISRSKLLEYMIQLKPCLVGIEACSGSNYWSRKFREMGHDVKQISPQFVKPYVKSNKNDEKDAEAICEAVTRPNMRFVPGKTIEQEDVQAIHRIRSRLIKERTALVNQIRGLLGEYGIVIPQGVHNVRALLPEILDNEENELSLLGRELFGNLCEELYNKYEKIDYYEKQIERHCNRSETCKRLLKVKGVGPLIATAIESMIGDIKEFKNGRELSAYLGLVPKQYSSGNKQRLLGISKRGNKYLRSIIIHGARAVVSRIDKIEYRKKEWINGLIERMGINRATVALANKNIRIMWAIITKGEEFNMKTL